jgi:2-methylaconitate cis-trans-isomerase PrpF
VEYYQWLGEKKLENKMTARWINASYYRGGTSKGVFFKGQDLPTTNQEELNKIFLDIIGSPDPNGRQLNGMGGGVSSLSKCVIVSPSKREGIDVDYTFIQIAIDQPVADWSNNCGNLSSAVGPFAVNEGLVKVKDGEVTIKIYQVNTDKIIHSTFNVKNGFANPDGDYNIAGVSGSGSKIRLDYLEPGGSGTGKLLPTGNVIDAVEVDGKKIDISIVDAATPLVYIKSDDIGLKCTENPDELDANTGAMKIVQAIRNKAAVMIGLAKNENEVPLGTPRIGIVSEPRDYVALDKSKISKDSYDICTRMFSMGKAHKAIMGTAGVNIGVACAIEGTLPFLVKRKDSNVLETKVGNPSGIITAGAVVDKQDNLFSAKSAVMYRTARPLMTGKVFF